MKYLPLQGIKINDIDISVETYTIKDPLTFEEVSYSPVMLNVDADSLLDLIEFTMNDEYRNINILNPQRIALSGKEIQNLLNTLNRRIKEYAVLYAKHFIQ